MRVLSRMSLLLALLLALCWVGAPVRVLETDVAHSQTLSVPVTSPVPTLPPLTVAVAVSPSPTLVGNLTTITATTLPNAACSITVLLPSGALDPAATLTPQGANNSGSVSWAYIPGGPALGRDTATVTCQLLNQTGVGSAVFIVLPIATPTASATPLPTVFPGVSTVAINGPNPILPGGVFSLNGSGFAPNNVIRFTVFVTGTSYTATVGANGTFIVPTVTVPYNQMPGPVLIVVRDNANPPDEIHVTITVAPVNPAITLSTSSGAPGDPVSVTGTGYGANEVVDVSLGPIVLFTAKADNSGSFTGSFTVPTTVPFGSYNVSGQGEKTSALNFAALLVTPVSPFAPTNTATGTPTQTLPPPPPTNTPTITPVPVGNMQTASYLAEGSTASGTHEYLNILNSAPILTHATVRLVFTDGTVRESLVNVPAQSLGVVDVNALVGAGEIGLPVSAQVSADQPVSVSRSIVRAGQDSTLSTGATAITHFAYFAEGYTGQGFHEHLALFNPVNANANVILKLLPSNGSAPIIKNFVIGPIRRYTVDVNALAPKQSLGAEVISDVELAVERTLTFGANQNGATTVAGVNDPASTWYFAEGSTLHGFSEFITLLNPQTTATTAQVEFFDPSGKKIGIASKVLLPNTRATINVGSIVHAVSVGAVVQSSAPILAERTMYRGSLSSAAVVGAGSFGRSTLSYGYDFPSGDTSPGHSEFILLLNPSATPLTAGLTFYASGGGVPVAYVAQVPAHSRITVDVGRSVVNLPKGLHGVSIQSSDGVSTFMAEQSLYGKNFSSAVTTIGIAKAQAVVAPPAVTAPPATSTTPGTSDTAVASGSPTVTVTPTPTTSGTPTS